MEPTKDSTHQGNNLNPCNPLGVGVGSVNQDSPPQTCSPSGEELCDGKFSDTQKRGATSQNISWLQDIPLNQKTGHGRSNNCDPATQGHIVNQTDSRQYVYRYNRSLRGSNEAMLDLFRDIVVLDESSQAHPIPVVWGRQERAVALILQDNVSDDGSLTLDRLRLPMMAIHFEEVQFDSERYIYHKALNHYRGLRPDGAPGFTVDEKFKRDTVFGSSWGLPINITYTLWAWTRYEENMLQIIEQVLPKISPMGYISVNGVDKEIPVILDGSSGNLDSDVGDMAERVLKYQWNMTVKTFIPLPLRRDKAVLAVRTDISLDKCKEELKSIIDGFEETEEFE